MNLTNLLTNPKALYTEQGILLVGNVLKRGGTDASLIRMALKESAAARIDAPLLYLLQYLLSKKAMRTDGSLDPDIFAYLAEIELIFLQEDALVLQFWEMVLASLSHEPVSGVGPSFIKFPFLNYILKLHESNAPILLALYELSRTEERAIDILTAIYIQFDSSGVVISIEEQQTQGLFKYAHVKWQRHPHLSQTKGIYYGRGDHASTLRVYDLSSFEILRPVAQKVERRLDWIGLALDQMSALIPQIDLRAIHGKRIHIVGEAAQLWIISCEIDTSERDLSLILSGRWKYGTFHTTIVLEPDPGIVRNFQESIYSDDDRTRSAYSIALHLALLSACNQLGQTKEMEYACDPFKIVPD